MPREPIPEELRRFLLTSVPSVPFVEALLLLREARGEPVETTQVARRLSLPEHAAVTVLEQLASYYRSHLVEITDVIHSRTGRKAQKFADAFKWRKDS